MNRTNSQLIIPDYRIAISLTVILILILLNWVPRLYAQTSKVITVVDTTQATVGDQIHLTLQVVYPTGKYAEFPEIKDKLGEFDVLKREIMPPEEYKRWSQRDLHLTLTIWDTGKYQIPEIPVSIRNPEDTSDVVTINSRALDIQVFSVLSGNEQLKDIKPPFSIPFIMPWMWVVIGLIALVAAVGAVFLRKWWVKTHPSVSIDPYYLLSPHERAFRRLDRLESAGLPSPEECISFFTELSEILREYLEGRYFIRALEMSTPEIIESIGELPLKSEEQYFIRDFLSLADLVKFALFKPDQSQISDSFLKVKEFIENTKLIIGEWEATTEEEESYDRSSKSG